MITILQQKSIYKRKLCAHASLIPLGTVAIFLTLSYRAEEYTMNQPLSYPEGNHAASYQYRDKKTVI